MFEQVYGSWPAHERFILVSCDETYLNKYFPRFYKTFTDHWQLPIHVHVIDPSGETRVKLQKLRISFTYCDTKGHNWAREVNRYRATVDTETPDAEVQQWLYECYCQCQRFVVLGTKMTRRQSVLVADVDAYAQHTPTKREKKYLFDKTCFSRHSDRLMATFCHFHPRDIGKIENLADVITRQLKQFFVLGMDQTAIKQVFKQNKGISIMGERWIRHFDVKNKQQLKLHQKTLVYHEKGQRGKYRPVEVTWTDIE